MSEISIARLRETIRYESDTGHLYWLPDDQIKRKTLGPIGYKVQGYIRIRLDGKNLLAHRVIWAMHFGEWPSLQIDHCDRDRSNNRIENLRLATSGENKINMAPRGAISLKGVSWEKRYQRYRARIKINRKEKHLGNFRILDEAAHAYNKAAIALHGEFAVLNPIGQDKK